MNLKTKIEFELIVHDIFLLINIQIIKEEYIKEIEKYKEIKKQKDEKINEINNKMINDKISLEKILLL